MKTNSKTSRQIYYKIRPAGQTSYSFAAMPSDFVNGRYQLPQARAHAKRILRNKKYQQSGIEVVRETFIERVVCKVK